MWIHLHWAGVNATLLSAGILVSRISPIVVIKVSKAHESIINLLLYTVVPKQQVSYQQSDEYVEGLRYHERIKWFPVISVQQVSEPRFKSYACKCKYKP